MCYWCWDGVMWGVCTMGWTTWRLRDCWCCLTGAAWMMLLWQWFFCCLLSKLHGDRVTDATATTPGSTEWTAGTTAWQLRDCWCCLTGADYISLDCVHGISCKFIMTGVPGQVRISRLGDFVRSYNKMSFSVSKRGPDCHITWMYKVVSPWWPLRGHETGIDTLNQVIAFLLKIGYP